MEIRYHCQQQAMQFKNEILPVPMDYPLKDGLPEDFRSHFVVLCELAKKIYEDMAHQPEMYGLMLLDINETDHNLIRNSFRSIHRLCDLIHAIFHNGEMQGNCLNASATLFRLAAKKIPKYGLVLSKLQEFGFVISDFDGKMVSRKKLEFTLEYPDNPAMIPTLKAYCDCFTVIQKDRADIKLNPDEFHHHFYRFDYKITAELSKIPMLDWVKDEADYSCFSDELKAFYIEFYRSSLQYEKIKYDGDYYYKSKRIARIMAVGYIAMGNPDYRLSLKLKNIDQYMSFVETLPEDVTKSLQQSSCRHCDFQGATDEFCKYRVHWTFKGVAHIGCVFDCFYFDDFDVNRIPDYFALLEREYGIVKE